MSGEISGEEYQGFVQAVDECFAKGDEVNLVLDLKGVEFYKDFDAMKQDFKFTAAGAAAQAARAHAAATSTAARVAPLT